MANYRSLGISDAPFKIGGSGSINAYRAVAPGSVAGEVIVAVGPSGNPWPLGLTQEAGSPGQETPVRVMGFSKALCRANACSLRWGAWLICASDGFLEPQLTGGEGTAALPLTSSPIFARYMDSGAFSTGAASILAQVYIFPFPLAACGVMSAS